jgi:hypothetical protein
MVSKIMGGIYLCIYHHIFYGTLQIGKFNKLNYTTYRKIICSVTIHKNCQSVSSPLAITYLAEIDMYTF